MTWPPVFDGIGAMFVRCDNDPDVQLGRIKPTPTWVVVKVNGGDISPLGDIKTWLTRVRNSHPSMKLGVWVYCYGPPIQDVRSWQLFHPLPELVVYDVESQYKTDEGAPDTWPGQLVAAHPSGIPAAVTSYGAIPGYGNQPSSLDFRPFAAAGWPVIAQIYNGFTPGVEITYTSTSGKAFPGPYPAVGVHRMLRSLTLTPGEAVYRPEGIDS